jgi:hypothetical protein
MPGAGSGRTWRGFIMKSMEKVVRIFESHAAADEAAALFDMRSPEDAHSHHHRTKGSPPPRCRSART